MKKYLCVFLSLLFVFSCMIPVFATADPSSDESHKIEPTRFTYISAAVTGIHISGLTATCAADLVCYPKTMSCAIRMELQKLKNGTYETIEAWSDTYAGYDGDMSQQKTINPLSTYRLKTTFSAYYGNQVETTVIYAYP